MRSNWIWALTLAFIALVALMRIASADYEVDSGDDDSIPVDEDGKIECQDGDPICEKYQALESYNEEGDASFNKLKVHETRLRCNNPANKYICEVVQKKICYTNGKCGDLVQEQNPKSHDPYQA